MSMATATGASIARHGSDNSRGTQGSLQVLPCGRLCPVAPWFTPSHVVVKTLLVVFSLASMVLLFSWESEGLRIFDLDDNTNDLNYRNYIYSYILVAFLTIVYAISMTILGCGGCEVPAITQAIVTGVYLFVWLVTSAFISATVDNISNTKYVRERGVNVMLLMIANGCGFLVVVFLAVDIFLAFVALRALDEAATIQELESARSDPRLSVATTKHVTGRGSYSYRHRFSSAANRNPGLAYSKRLTI